MLTFFSTGMMGGKVQDLNNFAPLMEEAGFHVPDGFVILSDMSSAVSGVIQSPEDEPPCPEELTKLNRHLLSLMEVGAGYAVRSSPLSEAAGKGIGIYHTNFIARSGDINLDLSALWHAECAVYRSEFSMNAKAWRKHVKSKMGMALLIQKLEGKIHRSELIIPSYGGVAYTSERGKPLVRVECGFGINVVRGKGAKLEEPPSSFEELWEMMKYEDEDGYRHDMCSPSFDLSCGYMTCPPAAAVLGDAPKQDFSTLIELFEKLAVLRQHGEFYLEWVICDGKISCVQCAQHQDEKDVKQEIEKNHLILASSSDVLHPGRTECSGVVIVNRWTKVSESALENLNNTQKGYLLMVTESALSELSEAYVGTSLEFRHFSNSGAVCELQGESFTSSIMSHAANRKGANHFSGLCREARVLFMGVKTEQWLMEQILCNAGFEYSEYHNVDYFHVFPNVSTVAVVSDTAKEGWIWYKRKD